MQSGMVDPFSASFPSGYDRMSSKADPGATLASVSVAPSGRFASTLKAHDRLDDLLPPLFLGCLLIALARFMKATKKNLKVEHHARDKVSAGVSYKDTLTVET
jgi:hypothetical protein